MEREGRGINLTHFAFRTLTAMRNPFADPQYSADHGFYGPLPHIFAGDVVQHGPFKIMYFGVSGKATRY